MDKDKRITELEVTLELRDAQIKEAKEEREEALELVGHMREQVEEAHEMIDNWKSVFDMQMGDAGGWMWDPSQNALWEAHVETLDKYRKLISDWNKFVGRYNRVIAPKGLGRPLAASEAQSKDVLKRRKDGASLRAIASATSISLRTVRTIVEKDAGADRTSKRSAELRKREFDRLRAADYRARKKARDRLPAQITEIGKRGEELIKAAKGLGRR